MRTPAKPSIFESSSAKRIGSELALWLPKLRYIYDFENRLSKAIPGNLVQKNLGFRKSLHNEWKSACRAGDDVAKAAIVRKYVHEWGGVHSHADGTLERYAKTHTDDLIALGMTGISSWSKAISIRSPRQYPIYDARVAISLNALQAIILGEIHLWFSVPGTQIKELDRQAKRLKKLMPAKSKIPHEAVYREYLNTLDEMRLSGRRQRTEMLLFSLSRDITIFLASLPDAQLNGATLQAYLPNLRRQLKV